MPVVSLWLGYGRYWSMLLLLLLLLVVLVVVVQLLLFLLLLSLLLLLLLLLWLSRLSVALVVFDAAAVAVVV